MAQIVKVQSLDGRSIEFYDEVRGQGAMKDCYLTPDGSYVVLLYREHQSPAVKDRLSMITTKYQDSIFKQAGGEYWKQLLCWPTNMVEVNGKLGVVVPVYQPHFYFLHGSVNNDVLNIKGREKEGKWFASAKLQKKFLDSREKGDWLAYLGVCIRIARGVRRLHAAGLAHSDLSYKNVLVNPSGGNALIIDLDGLVVPGKYPPDVAGTPDFMAPEVVAGMHLPKANPHRILPSISTDRHALAVLIYMYLLYRHPLKGDKNHDPDPSIDDSLAMGSKALWVENPADRSNRIKLVNVSPAELPWKDIDTIPFSVTGPYLSDLFRRAFIDGLHNPGARPTADDWEHALVKTADLVQKCANPSCAQKWFTFDNTTAPRCPFCGTPFHGQLPVLDFYSAKQPGKYRPDNHRLMVYPDQSLYQWHINRNIFPNEKLEPEQLKRVGYFQFHQDSWWLVNTGMPDLTDVSSDVPRSIPVGQPTRLTDGQRLVLSKKDGGRLAFVQLVNS